jgi:hypothetical protein
VGKLGIMIYTAAFLVFGFGGISFQAQPISGYLSSAPNNACPSGSIWMEKGATQVEDGGGGGGAIAPTGSPLAVEARPAIHYCKGGTEYVYTAEDESTFEGNVGESNAGAIWIEGRRLHFVGADTNTVGGSVAGDEYSVQGSFVTTSTGPSGSIWVENGELRYVDEFGNERKLKQ